MKTEITRFCEACLHDLQPLPAALEAAAKQLEQGTDKALLATPLAALNDVQARLRALVEKLGNQQAYLLIFGPLKSGKSTLMNAISGSYVSEVTSLPGYPCLVFVRHAERQRFSVTRYNGRETVFANGTVLKDVIDDSHVALAHQIRATEGRGEAFDPRTHFTEAIRRIDIRLPVQTLGESSTVLVDTPGLYSRMNFGYDMLTREFRDTAACALFVVKTDNLFLEQVFAEFNQLLGLFSRIFLIINVDSNKRDLQPDGTLLPSAESQHPEKIIEAFTTLSMAGPMRAAYDEKRVRIHAVDLLGAASSFLTGQRNGESAEHPERAAFDAFLSDLTDYLNSSDYTTAFIRDSLRQGSTLCDEACAAATSDPICQLLEKQEALTTQMRELDERIEATDRLLKADWDSTFEKVRAENSRSIAAAARVAAERLGMEMRSALDKWYETPTSLKALEVKRWNPLLTEAGNSLAEQTRTRVRNLIGTSLGGAEPAASIMTDLHAVGFRLGSAAHAGQTALTTEDNTAAYAGEINETDVPVRKSFVDWLLFRSQATVRRRLFGEDLTQQIEPEIKLQRLPDTTRDALRQVIDKTIAAKFPVSPTKYSEALLNDYIAKFCADVLSGLKQLREQLVKDRADRQTPFEINAKILEALGELDAKATAVAAGLSALAQKENVGPMPLAEPASAEPAPAADAETAAIPAAETAERAPEPAAPEPAAMPVHSNGAAPAIANDATAASQGDTLASADAPPAPQAGPAEIAETAPAPREALQTALSS
jgi:GTPase SAR1 family protein